LGLWSYDKISLNSALLGDFSLEKAGLSSMIGLFICMFYLNKFQKRFNAVYKEDILDNYS
jgi:hypothetical protein